MNCVGCGKPVYSEICEDCIDKIEKYDRLLEIAERVVDFYDSQVECVRKLSDLIGEIK